MKILTTLLWLSATLSLSAQNASIRGQLQSKTGEAKIIGVARELLKAVVPAAGIEPATFRSGGERSNPLSYAGLNKIAGSKRCIRNVPLFVPLFAPLVNNGCSASGPL